MRRVYHSIALSALDRYGSLLFFLVSTAVLARLLTPLEFGVYAVVNALTTIVATSLQEFGGANYLIQKQHLSEQHVRTAFTIIFATSAAFGASLFLLRYPIMRFFGQNGLETAIAVSCLNLFISPFSVTMSALQRRELAFAPLARSNLAGSLATAAVSIGLAMHGWSFMAPVTGVVCGNAVTAISLLLQCKNRRVFRPSLVGHAEVVHFGAYSSSVVLINVFYNLFPQLVLARVLDFNAVGIYSRAVSMTQVFDRLVIQVMNPVISPTILEHSRSGGDLKAAYLSVAELISAFQWPFLTFLALLADPIILLWLGPNWSEVVPLVRIISIASTALFSGCLTYPILMAVGRVKDTLIASLISLPPSLAMILAASFYGVYAVAGSALVAMPLQAVVAIYFIARQLMIKPADLGRALAKSAGVTLCTSAGAAGGLGLSLMNHSVPSAELVMSALFAGTAWVAGLLVTKHPLLDHAKSLAGTFRLSSRAAQSN